jgi:hypothetical protein
MDLVSFIFSAEEERESRIQRKRVEKDFQLHAGGESGHNCSCTVNIMKRVNLFFSECV